MRRILRSFAALLALAGAVTYLATGPGWAEGEATSIFGSAPPAGYRDWRLVAVAHEAGKLNDLRAILGNDIAIEAFRESEQPFPDGTVLARLAWDYEQLPESEAAFGKAQSYVAVHPKNGVQFMVKDAKKYAATGGWGFAQFNDGKPTAPSGLTGCFACHQTVASRDFVFNRYAP